MYLLEILGIGRRMRRDALGMQATVESRGTEEVPVIGVDSIVADAANQYALR